MADILSLATAALKSGQLEDRAHLRFPRVDYVELQACSRVDVIDYAAYNRGLFGDYLRRIETQVRSDPYLAALGFLRGRRYRMVFAWSERAGIPYAAMRRFMPGGRPFAAMFTCWSERQEKTITRLNLFSAMDAIAVHCRSMQDHFLSLGAPQEKVRLINYSVDQRFFTPLIDEEQQPGLLLSLGEVRSRDYGTLFEAVDGLPVRLLAATSGAWYARQKHTGGRARGQPPSNVTISGGFSPAELKKLYAQSRFVVLPLYDQVYSAGATATLEAMSMGRAVIAFRSRGILDYILHGETGLLVEPGNAFAMRDAIRFLLDNPREARRMGENGRQRVHQDLNLDNYVQRIANWLESCRCHT